MSAGTNYVEELVSQRRMTDFKELCEGASIAGLYTTQGCLRREGESSFFTVKTAEGERLLLKLAPDYGADAERQFAAWERSRHLRHRRLLYLRDLGRTEIEGASYMYAVFEHPDDWLAPALRNGPLSEGETLGVFEAALSALRYLHGQGMVHGAVDAEHIVAIGDDVKLATDALRESDDLDGPLDDVRQLGELARAMRAPEPLTEPLASAVRHATVPEPRQRWTLAEIASLIEKQREVSPPPPPPPPPPMAPVEEIEMPVVPVPAAVPMPASAAELEPQRPFALEHANAGEETRLRPRRAMPKWPFAAAAALLLLILILHSRRKPEAPANVSMVTTVRPASAPVAPAVPADTRTWRVVAFSSRSRQNAAARAKRINHKWPELRAAVYVSKDHRWHYLVTLGEPMDREEAVSLQSRARSLGVAAETELQE